MALDANIVGGTSGSKAEVDAGNRLKVIGPNGSVPADVPAVRFMTQNDAGDALGVPYLGHPESDDDSRMRIAHEAIFASETFNYTAQATGKHVYRTNTMASSWTAAGVTTNSGNITTTTTSTSIATYAEFPLLGASQLYCEIEGSFTAQPTTNVVIDFGMMRLNTTAPLAPIDGVHFRLNAGGLSGVLNFNGAETSTALDFTYDLNRKYQFIIAMHEREVEFWVDGTLYAKVETPIGQGQPCMSTSLPFAVRHAIVGGAAGSAISFNLNDYTVSVGGPNIAMTASIMGQRIYGSYEGLSGATQASLATLPNSTNPTAAAPSNTALTANLPSGIGGQGLVTAAVAAATDGIWASTQVPAGSVNVQGRRMVIRGVNINAVNLGAAVATTATTVQFSLAYGHTAASLATAEGVASKAPRRVALGFMSWPVGAAIGSGPDKGPIAGCRIPSHFKARQRGGNSPARGKRKVTYDCMACQRRR